MRDVMRDVHKFTEVAGQAIGEDPLPDDVDAFLVDVAAVLHDRAELLEDVDDLRQLRARLILEEAAEAIEAMAEGDELGLADGLVDLVYVVAGTGVAFGLPLEHLWLEVQRANMDKFPNGRPILDSGGKVMKPPGWRGPDIEGSLRNGGWVPRDER